MKSKCKGPGHKGDEKDNTDSHLYWPFENIVQFSVFKISSSYVLIVINDLNNVL